MQLELYWFEILFFLFKVYFNGVKTSILNNWNKCKQRDSNINKLITFCMQNSITFAIIWFEWLSMINKCNFIWSASCFEDLNTNVNHSQQWLFNIQPLLFIENCINVFNFKNDYWWYCNSNNINIFHCNYSFLIIMNDFPIWSFLYTDYCF